MTIQRIKSIFSASAKWLLTTLSILGLGFAGSIGYISAYGLPGFLREYDAKLTASKLDTLRTEFDQAQGGVVELLSWKENTETMQKLKVEKEKADKLRIKLAQK